MLNKSFQIQTLESNPLGRPRLAQIVLYTRSSTIRRLHIECFGRVHSMRAATWSKKTVTRRFPQRTALRRSSGWPGWTDSGSGPLSFDGRTEGPVSADNFFVSLRTFKTVGASRR